MHGSDPFTPPAEAVPVSPERGDLFTETVRRIVRHGPIVMQLCLVCGSVPLLGETAIAMATGDAEVGQQVGLVLGLFSGITSTSAVLRVVHAREGRSDATALDIGRGALADTLSLFVPVMGYQLAVGLGLIFGVFPGLWLIARLALVWPVWVLERSGMQRAALLSEGRRWPLLGAWLGAWLVAIVVFLPVSVLGDDSVFTSWVTSVWLTVAMLVPTLAMYEGWLRAVSETRTSG